MIGHTLGAAGGIEAGVTALTLTLACITPTINLTHPDPDCDLDYVPNDGARGERSNVAHLELDGLWRSQRRVGDASLRRLIEIARHDVAQPVCNIVCRTEEASYGTPIACQPDKGAGRGTRRH